VLIYGVSEQENKSSFNPDLTFWAVVICLFGAVALSAIPNFIGDGRKSQSQSSHMQGIKSMENHGFLRISLAVGAKLFFKLNSFSVVDKIASLA
jgi:hypothetical protein